MGTYKGTVPIATCSGPANLTAAGNTLFFTASDSAHGTELWQSDGTDASLVKDINPGIATNFTDSLTDVNSVLFFTASDGVHGEALWKSDGTAEGTVLVKEFASSGTKFALEDIRDLTAVGNNIYFVADYGAHGKELWKSDGTDMGTSRIMMFPGKNTALQIAADAGDTVFLAANDGVHGLELWRSDGTADGTMLVKDIHAGHTGGIDQFISVFAEMNGAIYFTANDRTHGFELWKSDGTEAGTAMVKEINVGPGGIQVGRYMYGPGDEMTPAGGRLYFTANDGFHGWELWSTDGTADGTALTKDLNTQLSDALWITGDAADDTIVLEGSNDLEWVLTLNGNTERYAELSSVTIDSKGGNDVIDLSGANGTAVTVSTGAGDDRIFGGSGNDQLTCGGGNDTLIGNKGDDTLLADDSDSDLIDGSDGDDSARSDDALDRLLRVENLIA